MKHILKLILLTLATVLCADEYTVQDVLQEYRELHPLNAGNGYIRQVPTPIALADGFREYLQDRGYASTVRTGRIQLTQEQALAWTPYVWGKWREMLRLFPEPYSSDHECDMAWVEVDVPALPDLLSRQMEHSWYAKGIIPVFPALVGELHSTLSTEDLLEESSYANLEKRLLENTIFSQTEILSFPTDILAECLERMRDIFASATNAPLLRHTPDFPGYQTRGALNPSPVKIQFASSQSNLSQFAPLIRIMLLDGETQILEWEGDGSPVSLRWEWVDFWPEPEIGDSLENGWAYPYISGNGAYSYGEETVYGRELTLRIQRYVNSILTDEIETSITSGTSCQMQFGANESHPQNTPLDTLLRESSNLQMEATLLLHAAFASKDASQLHVTLHKTILETTPEKIVTGKRSEIEFPFGEKTPIPKRGQEGTSLWLPVAAGILQDALEERLLRENGASTTQSRTGKLFHSICEKYPIPYQQLEEILLVRSGELHLNLANPRINGAVQYQLPAPQSAQQPRFSLAGLMPALLLSRRICESTTLPPILKLTALCYILHDAAATLPAESPTTECPILQMEAMPLLTNEGLALALSAEITHPVATATTLTLFTGDIPLQEYAFSETEYQRQLPLPGTGVYHLTLKSADRYGNTSILRKRINVPREAADGLPYIITEVEQLDKSHPIVNTAFTIRATAFNASPGARISLYLDDQLMEETNMTHIIRIPCNPDGWEEGPYQVTALLEDTSPATGTCLFYYSPLADDHLAPDVSITLDSWPITAQTTAIITATDASAVETMMLCDSQGNRITTAMRNEEALPKRLEIRHAASELDFNQGILVTAQDIFGNSVTKSFQRTTFNEQPVIRMDSVVFDGREHGESFQVKVQVSVPCDYIALSLNGTPCGNCAFPDTSSVIFSIGAEMARDGVNEIECIVWAGGSQGSVTRQFRTPPIRDLAISPRIVQPWAGTGSTLDIKARTLQAHSWSIHLQGSNTAQFVEGTGNLLQATFDMAGLPDGEYAVVIFIPELAAEITESITLDAVQNIPTAELTSPLPESTVKEGVLIVKGSATSPKHPEKLTYTLRLQDAESRPLAITDAGSTEESFRLAVSPNVPGSYSHGEPMRQGAVTDGELARIDLSALPDAPYTLILEVTAGGQTRTSQLTFHLSSRMKSSYFTYDDQDFTVPAAPSFIKVFRHYTTQDLTDESFGHGWSMNTSRVRPVMDEYRDELECVDYSIASVHAGGSRDITLTLSTGQRVTFRFSLEAGGGMSFCYRAFWRPPEGIEATLVPTCSEKLMVLPGMEPFWEAAGEGTPWNYFDFPGFILTEKNGPVTRIDRVYLGHADVELENGEYASLETYGDLKVASVKEPSGRLISFENDRIVAELPDGREIPILKIGRDDSGRAVRLETLGSSPTVKLLEYDTLGNLSATYRGVNGEQPMLHRRFIYGTGSLKHHIIKILDGADNLIMQIEYDPNGRMTAASGPGNAITTQTDAFTGIQTSTDALGRQTITRFDTLGDIASQTFPDGTSVFYEHDSDGRETRFVDTLGNATEYAYSEDGLLKSRSGPGGTTSYQYTNGVCTAVIAPNGNATTYTLDENGRNIGIATSGGNQLQLQRDAQGNVTALTFNGITSWHDFNAQGQLVSEGAELGPRWDYAYDAAGRRNRIAVTYLHPETRQEIQFSTQFDYDSEGRILQEASSDGSWRRMAYDENGHLTSESDDRGHLATTRHDAAGRIVEQVLDGRFIRRQGYDAAGQLLFVTIPQAFDAYGENLEFDQAICYYYDQAGHVIRTERRGHLPTTLKPTGTDLYHSTAAIEKSNLISTSENRLDAKGRTLTSTSPEGFATACAYDGAGNITQTTDSFGNTTTMKYGTGGRLEEITQPDGSSIRLGHDRFGRTSEIRFPDGSFSTRQYNDRGAIASLQDISGTKTHFSYSQDGLLTQVTPEMETGEILPSLQLGYDSTGSLFSVTDLMGNQTLYTHDAFARVLSITLPLGQQTQMSYSGYEKKPSEIRLPDGTLILFTYTAESSPLTQSIFAPSGGSMPEKTYAYDYHENGLLKSITLQDGTQSSTVRYSYDSTGKILSETRDSSIISFAYDRDDALCAYETPLAAAEIRRETTRPIQTLAFTRTPGQSAVKQFTITHNHRMQVTELTRPDGSRRITEYDSMGRITSVKETDAAGNAIFTSECQRDSAGRITHLQESWELGPNSGSRTRTFRYDAWGRLAKENSTSTLPEETYALFFQYDLQGNRTLCRKIAEEEDLISSRFDANDRLVEQISRQGSTCLQWSENGILQEISYPDGRRTRFLWDVEGKLRGVNGTREDGIPYSLHFDYDASGLLSREEKSIGSLQSARILRYASLMPGEPARLLDIEEVDASGNLCGASHHVIAGTSAAMLTNNGLSIHLLDAMGNLRGVRHPDGQTTLLSYDAFGNHLLSATSPIGFRGEWQSPECGLVYLRNRFYLPEIGCFISPDTAAPFYPDIKSLNRYAYCTGDPVNYSDPEGRFCLGALQATMLHYGRIGTSLLAFTMLSYQITSTLVQRTARFLSMLDPECDELYYQSACYLADQYRRTQKNATVIIHGVGSHDYHYADDFIKDLKGASKNQDMLPYLWSGFSNNLTAIVPTYYQHTIARNGLAYTLFSMIQKGYENINLISHSWGTVISKDTLLLEDVSVNLFVTMGSPLTAPTHYRDFLKFRNISEKNYNLLGNYMSSTNYRQWYNYYYMSDPVIHLKLNSPNETALMSTDSPLRFALGVKQFDLPLPITPWSHSFYWEDPLVIHSIAEYLREE